MDDLVIDEGNFQEYFHDVRTSKPQRGQTMAKYTARAYLSDGELKRDIISILRFQDARSTPKMLKKLACMCDEDSYRIPLEMARDMQTMTDDEVAQKEYPYTLEMFFYTKKEFIPKDDPHWTVINLLNLDSFLDSNQNVVTISTKEVSDADQQRPGTVQSSSNDVGEAPHGDGSLSEVEREGLRQP